MSSDLIANPPLNQLSRQTRVKLRIDLERAIADPIVRVIVLVGHGRAFSVGADIKELAQPWPEGGERAAMDAYVDAYRTYNPNPNPNPYYNPTYNPNRRAGDGSRVRRRHRAVQAGGRDDVARGETGVARVAPLWCVFGPYSTPYLTPI